MPPGRLIGIGVFVAGGILLFVLGLFYDRRAPADVCRAVRGLGRVRGGIRLADRRCRASEWDGCG